MAEKKGYRDFDNQKQLRQSQEQENLTHLSGDESRDDRAEAANQISAMDVQTFLGGPFMHPMHDAAVDQQFAPRARRFAAGEQAGAEHSGDGEPPGRVRNALGENEVPPGQAT